MKKFILALALLVGFTFAVDPSGQTPKNIFNGITYTFPSSQGGSGTVLQNNGSGTLSWYNIFNSLTYTFPASHGSSGAVLTNNASGVLTWSPTAITRLGGGSGVDSTASPTAVSTVAISGLTANDKLVVIFIGGSTGAVGQYLIKNTTDNVLITTFSSINVSRNTGVSFFGIDGTDLTHLNSEYIIGAGSTGVGSIQPVFTTNWTASWNLGLVSPGSGVSNNRSWSVYKWAGQ